jgi:hypothetical protein
MTMLFAFLMGVGLSFAGLGLRRRFIGSYSLNAQISALSTGVQALGLTLIAVALGKAALVASVIGWTLARFGALAHLVWGRP